MTTATRKRPPKLSDFNPTCGEKDMIARFIAEAGITLRQFKKLFHMIRVSFRVYELDRRYTSQDYIDFTTEAEEYAATLGLPLDYGPGLIPHVTLPNGYSQQFPWFGCE